MRFSPIDIQRQQSWEDDVAHARRVRKPGHSARIGLTLLLASAAIIAAALFLFLRATPAS